MNKSKISVSDENLIGHKNIECDVLLLGDMFYDELTANNLSDWLKNISKNIPTVLIGDPGRHSFKNHPMNNTLTNIYTSDLPNSCQLENNGFTKACVWQYKNS